jgi:hypothetical protein
MAVLEFENTPLGQEVNKILDNGPTSTNYTWEAIVHTPDEDLKPINLLSVNYLRSYSDSFGDELTITTLFGLGTFAHRIHKNRENLEVTLRKIPVNENQSPDGEGDIEAERFSAILVGDFMAPTMGQGREAKDEEALNTRSLVDVHFQLQDKACEQLRILMAGGIARNTKVQNFLSTTILNQASTIKVNGERGLKGFDMVKADNQDTKDHIVITHGVRLVDLADFIQKRIGVYNSGIGSYIQNNFWYVFPLYDTKEFNRRVKTLTMLVVPENKLSNVERTFMTEAGSTTIIVTGKTSFRDDAGSNYLNYGNGLRFADASKLLEEGSDTSGNKTKLTRSKVNGEFLTDQSTLKYAPVASNRITANPFPNLTLQASKRGGMFRAIWQNSDMSLIYPGMVVKIVYSENDEMKDAYGIIHNAQHIGHKPSGITSPKFVNQSVIDVFVNDQMRPLDE